MLKKYQHQKELQRERIEGKSCESLFSHIIVQGTNCSSSKFWGHPYAIIENLYEKAIQ